MEETATSEDEDIGLSSHRLSSSKSLPLPWAKKMMALSSICNALSLSLDRISQVELSLFFVMIAVYAEIGTMRNRVVGDRGCVNCYDHCAL
ncbi:hypothetical protein RHSIM_Rhsim12G0169000 [Rhododendron simsii]|uniref:Uncharacterized protein n=1 Tax=Rhododendron simsii TaxID=118357 RepID=A0A834G6B4_RHOSS|nr:hypothetical protein RHSIM_Rhsim12G0169000 [Rhododendron simsii]